MDKCRGSARLVRDPCGSHGRSTPLILSGTLRRLHLVWLLVLLIPMFPEFQSLRGAHLPPWGCVGGSRNVRDEWGKNRTTRWQSHTQRFLDGTLTRLPVGWVPHRIRWSRGYRTVLRGMQSSPSPMAKVRLFGLGYLDLWAFELSAPGLLMS